MKTLKIQLIGVLWPPNAAVLDYVFTKNNVRKKYNAVLWGDCMLHHLLSRNSDRQAEKTPDFCIYYSIIQKSFHMVKAHQSFGYIKSINKPGRPGFRKVVRTQMQRETHQ